MWNSIKTLATLKGVKKGQVFVTHLLGNPPAKFCEEGKPTFEIPQDLLKSAEKNGFKIEEATAEGYKLRLL